MARTSGLPHRPLTSRYQIYKQKTQEVVEWLIVNAGICDSSTLSAAIQTRKAADSKRTLKLKARALLDLAQTVKSNLIAVPPAIVKSIAQVVDYRREFADWHAAQDDPDHIISNDGHRYFITICQRVHDLLASAPVAVTDPAKREKGASAHPPVNAVLLEKTVCNLFAQLEMEEPSDAPLGQEPTTKTSRLTKEPAQVQLEGDDSEERAFILWCHLEDLDDVRKFIEKTWSEYAKGDVSLMTAALVLEVGLMLLHSYDNEFVQAYPEFKSWNKVMEFFRIGMQSLGRGTVYAYPTSTTSGNSGNSAPLISTRAADLLCPGAAHALYVINISVRFAAEKHGESILGPKANVFLPPLKDEHFNFQEYLGDSIHEITQMAHKHLSHLARSEFVVGLVEYCAKPSEDLPMWLVVGYEIYVYIFQLIGSLPNIAEVTWLDEMAPAHESAKEYLAFIANATYPIRPGNDQWLDDLDKVLKSYANWPFYVRAPDGRHILDESNPHARARTVMHLPCSMGNQLFNCKAQIHKLSLEVTGDLQQVVIMAHLYTAMRRYGILEATWHDMEFVLAQQKSVQPLFPKLSSDPFAMVKHFLVVLGTPATAFANGKVPRPPAESLVSRSCRRLGEPSQFIRNMDDRDREARFARPKLYEAVLTSMTEKTNASLPVSKKGSAPAQSKQFTPIELISTFKKVFVADEPQLNFNYFGFWMRCHDMFGDILADDEIYEALEDATKDDLGLCYVVVYHLLLGAAKAVERGKPVKDLPINLAATLMEYHIKEIGNTYSQAAFRSSSGRIPKELRPKLEAWPGRPVLSPAAQLLSEGPETTCVATASYETIYDPHGSEEKFEAAKTREVEICRAQGIELPNQPRLEDA